MSRNETAKLPRRDQAPVTAAEWFAGRSADPVCSTSGCLPVPDAVGITEII
jgi:hypothetical protein